MADENGEAIKMLRSFCDVCDQPLLHLGYDFERQFTSLMGPGVQRARRSGSDRRAPARRDSRARFLTLLQRAAEELRKRTEVSGARGSPRHRDKSD